MTRLTAWLEREYQTDAESLGAVRVFYALVLLTTALPRWLWISELPPSFYQPPLGLASLFSAPPPAWVFYTLNATIVAATVCLAFGLYSQIASIAVAVGLFVGNSFGYAFGKIDHDWLLILVPLAGAAVRWGNARSLDAGRYRGEQVASWPIALLAIAIAFGMFYAGSMKALTGWLSVDHLAVKTTVVDNAIANERGNAFAAFAVDSWPLGLWETMDWVVVAVECLFLVAVLRRGWFLMACATATGFHFANAVMLELQFACNLPAYALVAHWTTPKWFRPEDVPRALVTTAAVAVSALYCLVGNPAWLFAQSMGWEASNASQWPFTAVAVAVAAAWFATESGLFTVSRRVPATQLALLQIDGRTPVVLFDGYCGLCNGWVDLVMRHDRSAAIRFLPLQTDAGAALLSLSGLAPTYVDSILLLYHGRVYTHSSAVLRTLWLTQGPLAITALLFTIPAVIRDVVYGAIASRRYRWFGRKTTCRIPTPGERQRFLSDDDVLAPDSRPR